MNSILAFAVTPVPVAVITAGPAVVDVIVTVAVPVLPIVAVVELKVPRVVEKVTVEPVCGVPAEVQETVSVPVEPRLTGELATVGAVKVKFCVLTATVVVAVIPRAFAVMVSEPPLTPVTVNVCCPLAAVVSVEALSVLPLADVTVTA